MKDDQMEKYPIPEDLSIPDWLKVTGPSTMEYISKNNNSGQKEDFKRPRNMTPESEAFLLEEEQRKKIKVKAHFTKLKLKKETPSPKTHYWDASRNLFVRFRYYYQESNMRPDFQSLANFELVKIYNEMAIEAAGLSLPASATKRFSTREDGVRRCESLYESICKAKGADYAAPVPGAAKPEKAAKPVKETKAAKPEKPAKSTKEIKAAKPTKETKPAKEAKASRPPSNENRSDIAAKCGIRGGTNRERLINCLHENLGKQVALKAIMKAIYGSESGDKSFGAFTNVYKATIRDMKNSQAKFSIVEGKTGKEVSYALVNAK